MGVIKCRRLGGLDLVVGWEPGCAFSCWLRSVLGGVLDLGRSVAVGMTIDGCTAAVDRRPVSMSIRVAIGIAFPVRAPRERLLGIWHRQTVKEWKDSILNMEIVVHDVDEIPRIHHGANQVPLSLIHI